MYFLDLLKLSKFEEFRLFYTWLDELTMFGYDSSSIVELRGFSETEKEGSFSVLLYTKEHTYGISGRIDKIGRSYLGASLSNRKSYKGEDWLRGRDLSDGVLHYDVWTKIKNDILTWELNLMTAGSYEVPYQIFLSDYSLGGVDIC